MWQGTHYTQMKFHSPRVMVLLVMNINDVVGHDFEVHVLVDSDPSFNIVKIEAIVS